MRNEPPVMINGKRRATLNGISYSPPETPLRLADQYTVKGVYTLDFPTRPLKGSPKLARSVINGTYRGFMEIIFQNNDTNVQTYHMDGYAFFVVGYEEKSNFFAFADSCRNLYFPLFFLFIAEWTTGSGRRIVEEHITKGMESHAARHRLASLRLFLF